MELGILDIADHHLYLGSLPKACLLNTPDGTLRRQGGNHLHTNGGSAAPTLVTDYIAAHTSLIAGITLGGGVECYIIDAQADIAAVALFIERKHRAVARLHTPLRMTAIQRTCIAVLSVRAHKGLS